jgi:FAD/FMN-containing dehydrogenase
VTTAAFQSTVPIDTLRTLVNGRVIAPADPDYDDARGIFYGGFDRRPAAIVRPVDARAVARIVVFAREGGHELALRSGGHSLAGHSLSDGGLVLDLRDMNALDIDVAGRTAWAQPGVTAAQYTQATAAHRLATGFGDTGSVGVGGITLSGGIGFLVRKHGLTIDSLLAAEVVTADGEILHVDEHSHPDLFWAIRGGGGNFGVVTRLQLRLHEVDEVVGGMLILPATPDVIARFMALAEEAPEELSTIIAVMPAPPLPFVPETHHGRMVLFALVCYAGPAAEGEAVFAPFRALAEPIADMVRPMHYPEIYLPDEEDYHPTAVGHTMFLDTVDRDVAETILAHVEASDALMRVVQLRALGGAMARVPADATAFAHRSSRIMANVGAFYDGPEDRPAKEAWVADVAAALRQADAGAYVGFLADEGEARVRQAYPDATWDRLTAIKARYDPTNLFRLNHNIPPAATASEQAATT